MRLLLIVIAVTTVAFTQIASAADMPVKAPVYHPAVYNWSGFYVGLNAGAALDPAHVQTTATTGTYFLPSGTAAIAATGNQTFHTPGFTGGIQLGYNWQANNIVVGIETDFNYMGLKGSSTNTALYPCCAPGATFTINQSVKTNWLYTLRPRVGWANNNWLFYATGGLAMTKIKANFSFSDSFVAASESASISQTKAGWALGGGVEYRIAGGPWSVKAEYLRVDFGTVSTTSTNLFAVAPVPSAVFSHSVRLTDDIVRGGLNYKIGQ